MVDDIEMARPKGLLIPFDKFVILDILPPDKYKYVISTLMRKYVEHGDEPEELEDLEKMAFESLRSSMDTNIETYRRSILANRKNGRKGGRPRKATETDGIAEELTETHGFSEKPTKTDGGLKYKVQSTTDTKVSDSSSAEALPPTTKNRFSPPDVETVKNYFAEKGGTEGQAIRFHAYYESNGWKVGRNPMKNWKAAASGWISRDRDEAKKANAPRNRAFMASRPAEEAENAKDFLADAARRRPLKKQ